MIRPLVNYLTEERPPFLDKAGVHLSPPLQVVKASGPAGAARKIVFLVFSNDASNPAVVLKIVRDPAFNSRLVEEFDILNTLWQRSALQSNIPQPLDLFRQEEHLVLAEKMLPGVPLNLLLRRQHRLNKQLVGHYLAVAVSWLWHFQESGMSVGTTFLGREAVAERLACLKDERLPSAFVTLLLQEADKYRGLDLPLVNAHGDFWPGNLLWEDNHHLCGVNDWETFHPERPPFYDLFLFLTTFAQEQTWAGKNRAERFRHGFLDDTWLSHLLAGAVTRFFGRYKLPPETIPLFFACFLLEMATPGADDGLKRREQAGSWRALLQQYAYAPVGFRPFALGIGS